MENYLTRKLDWQEEDITNQYDELPLWSSPFGLLMLEHFPIGNYTKYLDIGFGTGFPLIDIAQRLGSNCQAFGIDPWKAGNKRTKTKLELLGIENICLIDGDASQLPFSENQFDLITSNLGINNFENPMQVLTECHRVAKPGGSICLTTNLTGTFAEFYNIYDTTIRELGLEQYRTKYNEHVKHRGTEESVLHLLKSAGFQLKKSKQSTYQMRFLNGTAFLNYSFTILGFMDSWRTMFDQKDKVVFFERLESNLNDYSRLNGELSLSIPVLYIECIKV